MAVDRALAAWVVVQRIDEIDFEEVAQHLCRVPLPTIITALLCPRGVYINSSACTKASLSGSRAAATCGARHSARR
jgi:hypothetical protein